MPQPYASGPELIHFAEFEFDARQAVLLRNGTRLRLQPQPFRVLEYLLSHAPAVVTREELADHVWGNGVHVDLDQSLNYCIRQIRQALGDNAASPRFIETLPRQGYRFLGVIEAPAAPAPPAIRPTTSVTITATTPHTNSRTITMAATALLVIALTTALLIRRTHSSGPDNATPIRALAVLPLDNLSPDSNQDYFVDGVTDELITMLAKDSTLKITSRTSVMQYKNPHRPLRDIAAELGVDAVLEGSVARSGDHVHINIQLIQADTDAHIWAESFDRNTKDMLSMPTEAAQLIAQKTNSRVATLHVQQPVSPEAHDMYLRGRYLWFSNNNQKAGEAFRKAIELQPDYALGWSGLAIYYGAGAILGELSPQHSLAQAEDAARKAVALDDTLPEAHLALGSALFIHRHDSVQALAEITRATDLDPRFAEAWHFRAKMLAALDRHSEAIDAQRKASELDPFARPWALALSLLLARNYDAALAEATRRLDSNPNDPVLYNVLADIYLAKSDKPNAVRAYEQELTLTNRKPDADSVQHAFQQGGYDAVLRWQITNLKQQQTTRYVSPTDLASLYAQLHQREQTLALLEEAVNQNCPEMLWVHSDSAYDFLHTDKRFQAILQKSTAPLAP